MFYQRFAKRSRDTSLLLWVNPLLLLCLIVPWIGCHSNEPLGEQPKQSLSIAAAANLKHALDAMVERFKASHPEIDVQVTYGSSGNLFAQIKQQIAFDVFLSADTAYPQRLMDEGTAVPNSMFPYARGKLVIWVPKDSNIDWDLDGHQCLLTANVRKIAIPNPKLAPYGRAAEESLRHWELWDRVSDKLVLGENIGQTLQFVDSGGADIGFNALSMVIDPGVKSRGKYWIVPEDTHKPILQAGVLLRRENVSPAAEIWREFMLGKEGQEVLAKFGYDAPGS